MGSDVYCVACGALASNPYLPEDDEETLDPEALKGENIEWMGDVRLIGQDWGKHSTAKVYVTGLAKEPDYGIYEVEPGTDENFPVDESGRPIQQLTAFDSSDRGPFVAPFHVSCMYGIFSRVIKHRGLSAPYLKKGSLGDLLNIDKEALWSALSSLAPETYHRALDIDYGPIKDTQEQYWYPQRGDEDFVADPISIPRLQQYLNQPPASLTSASVGNTLSPQPTPATRSSLESLPLELLLKIGQSVSIAELLRLSRCSKLLRLSFFGNRQFWANRTAMDMPFLWESPQATQGLDWARLYKDLYEMSTRKSPKQCLGLVNRRRIWNLCNILADSYEVTLNGSDKFDDVGDVTILDWGCVRSGTVAMTTWPNQRTTSTFRTLLLANETPESESEIVLTASFNSSGFMTSIEALQNKSQLSSKLAATGKRPENYGEKTEYAALSSGDYLQSIEVFIGDAVDLGPPSGEESATQSNDNRGVKRGIVGLLCHTLNSQSLQLGQISDVKRYYNVEPHAITVGLAGSLCSSGAVNSLGLLTAAQSDITTISGPTRSGESAFHMPQNSADKYLWKGEYPPWCSQLQPFHVGYWSSLEMVAQQPFEFLDLGSTDEQLSSIVSVSGDIDMGSFSVTFSDGTTKSVGPRRQAMQWFDVDGPGGERIVEIYVKCTHLPCYVLFVTNRGRNLVFGRFDSHSTELSGRQAPPDGYPVTGIYATWSERAGELQALAVAHATENVTPARQFQDLQPHADIAGRLWTPQAPPAHVKEEGPPTAGDGLNSAPPRQYLNNFACRASWLALDKPVASVKICFSHVSVSVPHVCVVGIVLNHSDGTVSAAGARELGLTTLPSSTEYPKCTCKLEGSHDRDKYLISKQPDRHYWSEVWECGGLRIVKVHVWTDFYLCGLQFENEAGAMTPVYGRQVGEKTTIALGPGDMLKLLSAENGRHTSLLRDVIIVGFQKLAFQGDDGGLSSEVR